MAYRCFREKDNFGSPINTSIPYRIINRPFGDEICIVDVNIIDFKADDIHPIIFHHLEDWDTGEKITSLNQLVWENPSGRKEKHGIETVSKVSNKELVERTVEIIIEGQDYEFCVYKDSKTSYLVKCEELKIDAVVDTKSGKWTVKGKGAKKYRDDILISAQEMKK